MDNSCPGNESDFTIFAYFNNNIVCFGH